MNCWNQNEGLHIIAVEGSPDLPDVFVFYTWFQTSSIIFYGGSSDEAGFAALALDLN
jgi:hypothetical protein